MKKLILLASVLGILHVSVARADGNFAWVCDIHGDMDGYRVGVIFGFQGLKGNGTIDCTSNTGAQVHLPVGLDMNGAGITFELSTIRNVHIIALGIGLDGDPNDLVNSFAIGPSAGLSLINRGIAINTAIQLTRNGGPNFELGFIHEQLSGIGFHLHIQTFEIKYPALN